MFRAFFIIIFSLTFLMTAQICAESRDPKIIAHEIYSEVYSPYCPGRLLIDCPSSSAKELKQEILNFVTTGSSKEEIKSELLKKYGKEISALPTTEGFSIFAWIIPGVFILIGIFIIARITIKKPK